MEDRESNIRNKFGQYETDIRRQNHDFLTLIFQYFAILYVYKSFVFCM